MDVETQTTLIDLASKSFRMTIHGHTNIEINHACHWRRTERIDPRTRKKIIIVSIACIILMISEICAGIISNSLSLIVDAAHLLIDFAGFMTALFAIWVAKRPPSQYMNFGWYRAEVIAALYIIVIIWFLVGILGFLAVRRIITGNYSVKGDLMIIVGALSIIVNFLMSIQLRFKSDRELQHYWHRRRMGRFIHRLHNTHNVAFMKDTGFRKVHVDKGIQTTESHIALIIADPKIRNERKKSKLWPAFLSALTDIIQSVAILIVGIIIYIRSDWSLADLILTFIFIILIMVTTFGILRDALLMLMESTPTFVEYDEIITTFLSIKGVHNVHNLRIWALNMRKIACIAHLDIEVDADPAEILRRANMAIHRRYQFFETTIQIDQ